MTYKRDLKRRVRQRQAETGESYVTALRHVRAAAPAGDAELLDAELFEAPPVPAISYVEMIDLTEVGAALGMKCLITMDPALLGQIEVSAMLRQLRTALAQPQAATMRAAIMDGEAIAGGVDLAELQSLERRITHGRAGATPGGSCLALHVEGDRGPVLVAFMLVAPPRIAHVTWPVRLVIRRSTEWRLLWWP